MSYKIGHRWKRLHTKISATRDVGKLRYSAAKFSNFPDSHLLSFFSVLFASLR